MTDDELLDHRTTENERDIERLFERTKEIPVLVEQVKALRSDVQAMREENTSQHEGVGQQMDDFKKSVDDRMALTEGRIITAAIALVGVFGAGLVGLLARGIG